MDLREIALDVVDWIRLAQGRELVNTNFNLNLYTGLERE